MSKPLTETELNETIARLDEREWASTDKNFVMQIIRQLRSERDKLREDLDAEYERASWRRYLD